MTRLIMMLMLVVGSVLPCSAQQLTISGYGGATFDKETPTIYNRDLMVMADWTINKLTIEPWVENTSYGSEFLYFPSSLVGGIVGVDDGGGGHVGVVSNLPKGHQLRVMRHSRGATEMVYLWNFVLPDKRFTIQPWVVLTSDHQSRALLGLVFKE